jgi:hypothetical protein
LNLELKFSDLIKSSQEEQKKELDEIVARNPQAVMDHSADILTAIIAYISKDFPVDQEGIEKAWNHLSKSLLMDIKIKFNTVRLYRATAKHLEDLC